MAQSDLDRFVAGAILGIDTLWGGDVMNPSGTGRFIADSWFSDEELPQSYTDAYSGRRSRLGWSLGGQTRSRGDRRLT